MRKKIADEIATKSARREVKKRPRMRMHGKSLLRPTEHSGKKITKQ